MKKEKIKQSSGEYIKEVASKLKDKSMYNWIISEVIMIGNWTPEQNKEINGMKQAIQENKKAIQENRKAIMANAQGIKANAEAINEVRKDVKANAEGIKTIIDILARNGMK